MQNMEKYFTPQYEKPELCVREEDKEKLALRQAYLSKVRSTYESPKSQEEIDAVWLTNKHIELLFQAGFRSLDHMARVLDELIGLYREDAQDIWWARSTGEDFLATLHGEILHLLTNKDFSRADSLALLHLVYTMISAGKSAESQIIRYGYSAAYFRNLVGDEEALRKHKAFLDAPVAERLHIVISMTLAERMRMRIQLGKPKKQVKVAQVA